MLAARAWPNLGATLATRLQLCGTVVLRIDGRRIEGELPGRLGRLLAVHLALNRQREVPRDELLAALWPDEPPAAAEASLSPLLSKVRRVVGHDRIEGRGSLRLRLPAGTWIDLEAAAEGLHRAESASARRDWLGVYGPGRVAQHIAMRGVSPWRRCTVGRRDPPQLEELHVRALELVGEACLEIGGSELNTAERCARRLVVMAPYRESGHRLLMRAHGVRGNPAESLLVYDALRTRLRDDLGAAPSAETQALHRRLLDGSLATPS